MGERDTIHQAATNAEKCDACQGHEVPGKIVFMGGREGSKSMKNQNFFCFFLDFFMGNF